MILRLSLRLFGPILRLLTVVNISAIEALMSDVEATESLEIHGLTPEPADEWRRLLRFVGFGPADKSAMSRTVEPLLARANERCV